MIYWTFIALLFLFYQIDPLHQKLDFIFLLSDLLLLCLNIVEKFLKVFDAVLEWDIIHVKILELRGCFFSVFFLELLLILGHLSLKESLVN